MAAGAHDDGAGVARNTGANRAFTRNPLESPPEYLASTAPWSRFGRVGERPFHSKRRISYLVLDGSGSTYAK